MAVHDLGAMLAGLAPRLDPETWVFCAAPEDMAGLEPLGWFREDEGASAIVAAGEAAARGLPAGPPMRRITLGVESALDGVGLTAAVASALAAEGIACNMVAALRHDHAFVPEADAARALAVLARLQAVASGAAPNAPPPAAV